MKPLPLALTLCLVLLSTLVWAAEPDAKGTGIAKLLNGRSYVLLSKEATCKANNPEHTVLKSWANRISFENGQLLVWGKVCNDTPDTIPLAQAGKNLLISLDLKRVVYKNEVLRYARELPALCDAGQWCPVEDAKP